MNKKLFLGWLNKKVEQNNPDGPIHESKKLIKQLRRELEYHKALAAAAIISPDTTGDKKTQIDPYSLEPKSGLIDFKPAESRQSIKTPSVEPVWSYRARNALGLGSNSVYENEEIKEGSLGTARTLRIAKAAIKTQSPMLKDRALSGVKRNLNRAATTSNTQLATRPNTQLATRPNTQLATRPNTQLATRPNTQLATRPGGPLATRPTSPNLPVQQTPPAARRVSVKPEESKPEEDIIKPTGSSNTLTTPNKSERDKSKYTRSVQPRQNISAFGLEPGSGNEYGGVVSESMKALINTHVNKFLKTREGVRLKKEASEVLTRKEN